MVTTTPDCTGLLLVVVVVIALFDEVLYDTIQAHKTQLKLSGHHRCHRNKAIKAVLLKMRLLVHDLLRRRHGIPQNARELEIKKPLQSRLCHRLHWVDPHHLFQCVKIGWLDQRDQKSRENSQLHLQSSIYHFVLFHIAYLTVAVTDL